jgi:6-phosphogluconolactonase
MENIVISEDAATVAARVAHDLADAAHTTAAAGRRFHLALSGGSTPRMLYEILARGRVPWKHLELFWGDERCVPPDREESNFHMAREAMLKNAPLVESQIHRIRGEDPPDLESARYEDEITRVVPANRTGLPSFDWILLGMGDDGHTASLFPGAELSPRGDLCGVARHPETGQRRVSFTFDLINAAAHVSFLVTGPGKADMLAAIIGQTAGREKFPAARVAPRRGTLTWYLDREAGAQIRKAL